MLKNKLHGQMAIRCSGCKAISLESMDGWTVKDCANCSTPLPHPFFQKNVGRPSRGRKARRITIVLPQHMWDVVELSAEQHGTTPSAIIRAGISALTRTPE